MDLAGRVPGGAINIERLKEISAKESRNRGLRAPAHRGTTEEGGVGLAAFGDWLLARSHIPLLLLMARINQSMGMG